MVGAAALRPRAPLERKPVFVLAIALLVAITVAAELRSYAQPDIAFLLDAAGRVLDGARLYVDIIEINPPLVVALNVVAVWWARVLGVSEILVYRLGFTAILLGLLWLAAALLRRVVPDDVRLRRALVLALAFVLFPLAGRDFGEREHLVLALLVPYLVLGAARLTQQTMPKGLAGSLGLLAGVALALKPHFLPVWLATEGALRVSRRVPRRAMLPESVAIAAVLGTYVLLVLALTPAYLELLGLLAGPYTRFLHHPFLGLLVAGPGAVLVLFALLAVAALRPQARHPALWFVLAVGAAACLIGGAAQQKGLGYHFYPAFGLATLLLALIAADGVTTPSNRIKAVYRSLVGGVLAGVLTVAGARRAAAALAVAGDPGRAQLEQLIALVRARSEGAGVFVMSYHLRSAYPLINYAGARSASRFPHLWVLASEYLDALRRDAPLRFHEPAEMSPSERYLNDAVREDLRQRPELLVIFRPARDFPENGYRRLDYIGYFARDPAIGALLREYQLVGETGDYLLYERVPQGAARRGDPPAVTPGTLDIVPVVAPTRRLGGNPILLAGLLAFLSGTVAAWRRGPESTAQPVPLGAPRE